MMGAKAIAMVGLALSLGFTLGTPALSAEDSSAETMAAILIDLNHFPTDAEKETLQAIVDDEAASEQERTVASAMINLQHKATAADKEKMRVGTSRCEELRSTQEQIMVLDGRKVRHHRHDLRMERDFELSP